MEEIYITFNKNYYFFLKHKKIICIDKKSKGKIILHGKLTNKILIPCFHMLFSFEKLAIIQKKTKCTILELKELVTNLEKRKLILVKNKEYFINTNNHINNGINNKSKRNILILSNFYMEQFDDLVNYYKENYLIQFDMLLLKSFFTKHIEKSLLQKNNNINYIISDNNVAYDKYDLILLYQYGNSKELYNWWHKNMSSNYNIPIINVNLTKNTYYFGPLYIPKKTASLDDFFKCNRKILKESDKNFIINPLISYSTIAYVINDINWYFLGEGYPVSIDAVLSFSTVNYKNNIIHLYKT